MPKTAPKQEKWLEAALKQVPRHGWTVTALEKAAEALKADKALVRLQFPNGAGDLVRLFHQSVDTEMEARIRANKAYLAMRISEKVAFGVKTRLELVEKHKEAIRRLHGWAAMPLNAPLALKLLWATADKIWWLAGDTATDYNHYTKRILLSQLYERTLLFWLDDTSKGHTKTWAYLDERIAAVLKVGREIGKLKDMAGMAGAFIKTRLVA
ncbi:MAG: COQ9 family protein [Bdellovibrionales bacterium]